MQNCLELELLRRLNGAPRKAVNRDLLDSSHNHICCWCVRLIQRGTTEGKSYFPPQMGIKIFMQ